jgi:hypothetical protein
MTARQEQLDNLLYLRLYPLRRLLVARVEAMYAAADELFEEAEYEEEAAKLVRLQPLIDRVASRLPPLPPLFPEDEQQPLDL